MNKVFYTLGTIACTVTLIGCSHLHKVEEPQQKSEIPAGFRVGIGGKEVKEGDKLNVYTSSCRKVYRGRAGDMNECRDKKIGNATVLKVLDQDSAIVQPQDDFKMDGSMTVEKQEEGEQG